MKDENGDLSYLVSMNSTQRLTDHLGSVVAITNHEGTLVSQQRYLPFGGVRTNIASGPIVQTDYGYTGQRNLDEGIGLMDYRARFYSPVLNRFIQPDSIVPNPMNPQMFNRFSYVGNNPINFNDPTGHISGSLCGVLRDCSDQSDPWQDSDRIPTFNPPRPTKPICSSSICNPNAGSPSTTPQIGPTTNNPNIQPERDIVEEINTFWWVMHDLVIEPLRDVSNLGTPYYKQIKGFIPYGYWGEGILGASFQFLNDLDNPQLTPSQRIGRALIVGAENVITDIGSSLAGTVVGGLTAFALVGDFVPLDEIPGGGTVFFIAMVSTNVAMTDYFDSQNEILFDSLGLSNP